MSIVSCERNVARGVAGPYLPVCYPAALEQVSPQHSYRPSIYRDYHDFVEWWDTVKATKRKLSPYREQYTAMLDRLLQPLGDFACQDVEFKRATTPIGWMRIVNRLLAEDYRIVADIRPAGHRIGLFTCHSVGLIPGPEEGYVILASTHVPRDLQGIVPLQKVAERMYYVPEIHGVSRIHPEDNANITAIPAA